MRVGSKLGFLVPLRVNLESNLVKVDENLQLAQVWHRSMKNVFFWDDSNQSLTLGQPTVD